MKVPIRISHQAISPVTQPVRIASRVTGDAARDCLFFIMHSLILVLFQVMSTFIIDSSSKEENFDNLI